jgi:hypothetical protein
MGFCGGEICSKAELEAGGYIQDDSLLVRVAFANPQQVTVLTGSEALLVVHNVAAHLASKDYFDGGRYALGPFGHQFQLPVDFGDDDDSIGLYCGTRPGPYDDALAWPFDRSFTLTLVGRGGSGLDRSTRIPLPDNVGEAHFNKGTTGARGDVVCTLAELQAGGYIQNDTILVKVVFAAPGGDLESDSHSDSESD